jgi:hypothetical protein
MVRGMNQAVGDRSNDWGRHIYIIGIEYERSREWSNIVFHI